MWSVLYIFLWGLLWYLSFSWSPFHQYLVGTGTFIYGIFYFFSLSHKQGSRQWSFLRSLKIWDWLRVWYFSHHIHSIHWTKFQESGQAYLFIVHPNIYSISTMMTFGAHGSKNTLLKRLSPLVMIPKFYFYLPGIYDVIQWFGGIIHSEFHLKNALDANISVVWPPVGNQKSQYIESPQLYIDDVAPLSIFEWLINNGANGHIHLVPVLHTGERHLYRNLGNGGYQWLTQTQNYFHTHYGTEFPLFILGLFGSCIPQRAEIHTYIGEPISIRDPKIKTADELRKEFERGLKQLNIPDMDNEKLDIINE